MMLSASSSLIVRFGIELMKEAFSALLSAAEGIPSVCSQFWRTSAPSHLSSGHPLLQLDDRNRNLRVAIVNPCSGTANLLSLSWGSAYDDCDDGERKKNNPSSTFPV